MAILLLRIVLSEFYDDHNFCQSYFLKFKESNNYFMKLSLR